MHAYIHSYTQMHACLHACMHAYIHTYITYIINKYWAGCDTVARAVTRVDMEKETYTFCERDLHSLYTGVGLAVARGVARVDEKQVKDNVLLRVELCLRPQDQHQCARRLRPVA